VNPYICGVDGLRGPLRLDSRLIVAQQRNDAMGPGADRANF
jgi:hypothetical protein